MWWQSFTEGVAEHLVAEGIIVSLAGGGLIAWLKRRASSWLTPICWGISGTAVILIGVGALRLIAIPFPDRTQLVTSDNVEALVVGWLDHFRLNVRNEPMEGSFFRRVVTMPNGNAIAISRTRVQDHYVLLDAGLRPTDDDQRMLAKLTPQGTAELVDEMRLEAARLETNCTVTSNPIQAVFEKRIPITNALTEDLFIGKIDEMDSAEVAVQETVRIALRKNGLLAH
jgi:hypothetical protein